VARNDGVDVHLHDSVDGLEPLADVRVVRERRDVVEGDVAGEQNLVLRDVDDQIAVRVCGSEELHFDRCVSVVVDHFPFDRRRRRDHLPVFGPVGPAITLIPFRGRGRDRLENFVPAVWMADDFNRRKKLIAIHVIAVMVRVDQATEGLVAGCLAGRGEKGLGMERRSVRVDGQQVVFADDEAAVRDALVCLAWTAALDVREHVGSELPELGFPARDLRKSGIWWRGGGDRNLCLEPRGGSQALHHGSESNGRPGAATDCLSSRHRSFLHAL
jgi:hypothetical protein